MLYRWQYTNTLSILNRLTGLVLSAGLLALVYWLVAAASGPESHARAQALFAHPLSRLLLLGVYFSFFFHLANGVRHLVWDLGYGFERRTARLSGWVTFILSVVLTLAFWLLTVAGRGGAA